MPEPTNGDQPPVDRAVANIAMNPWAPIGEQFGLGPLWAPASFNFEVSRVTAEAGEHKETRYIVSFTSVNGRTGYAFDDNGIRAFLKVLNEKVSGLALP